MLRKISSYRQKAQQIASIEPEAGVLLDLAETIVAPELIAAEVNAPRASLPPGSAAAHLPRARDPAHEHALRIALALGHPVCNCMDLACADFAGAPLITDDRRFLRAAGKGAWRDQMIALERLAPQAGVSHAMPSRLVPPG